jgi:hypothetical protein
MKSYREGAKPYWEDYYNATFLIDGKLGQSHVPSP